MLLINAMFQQYSQPTAIQSFHVIPLLWYFITPNEKAIAKIANMYLDKYLFRQCTKSENDAEASIQTRIYTGRELRSVLMKFHFYFSHSEQIEMMNKAILARGKFTENSFCY